MTKRFSRRTLIILILFLSAFIIAAVVILIRQAGAKEPVLEPAILETGAAKGAEEAGTILDAVNDCRKHVYSHRGASKDEIEHTFAAYDKAKELGSVNLEQDLVISKDGTLYCSHDTSAYRITGYDAEFSGMTDDEIDSLQTADGQVIPKLSDVFDRYGDTVNYIIELKSTDADAAEAFIGIVNKYGNSDRVVVQCFELGVLEQVEQAFPEMKKLYLCKSQYAIDEALDIPYVDIISVKKDFMTEDNCEKVHAAGKEFSVWTIDTEDEIIRAIELGVDSYFTNDTELALRLEWEYR